MGFATENTSQIHFFFFLASAASRRLLSWLSVSKRFQFLFEGCRPRSNSTILFGLIFQCANQACDGNKVRADPGREGSIGA